MSYSQPPIDIHCSRLVDWLVQHRHCRKDWGQNLATIRRKIKAALLDMPEIDEVKQLLIGSKLDYFKSKQILELLKTTEAGSKNIFGYYSSQRMKDWQDIVYSYETDCVYLAEVATDLIRETNYEVPGIRKAINKLKSEREEAEKERANLQRRAQQFNSEYQKLAQSFDIAGVNIGQELLEKSKQLSGLMSELAIQSKDLSPHVDYYRESASSTSKQSVDSFLPMLKYIIDKGNTTVYEWKHGVVPDSVELVEATSTACNSNSSEIELVDDEIDFGEDLPSSESSSGFVHVDKTENGNKNVEEDAFITVEGTESRLVGDTGDRKARGDEAKLVLGFRKSRNQFLNNLHELEAFFVQMLNDLTSPDDHTNSFVIDDSSKIRKYDAGDINQLLTKIRHIIVTMNLEANRIQFQMSDSPTFIDNLKEMFAKKLRQASDCNLKADMKNDHIRDIEDQIRESEILLKKSIASARELQGKVESSIEEIYRGRHINIMGCVN